MALVRLLLLLLPAAFLGLAVPAAVQAGNQQYEPMSAAVRIALSTALGDRSQARVPPEPVFDNARDRDNWLSAMSERLPRQWKPEARQRIEFLSTLHYEAHRAGLDPTLVLGLIEVESAFRRYAVSTAGARGYMQVMPFWTQELADGDASALFDLRTNLRYGCIILRHYLDREAGDLTRALARYNGSLGRTEYPERVFQAWRQWRARVPARLSPPEPSRGSAGPSDRGPS